MWLHGVGVCVLGGERMDSIAPASPTHNFPSTYREMRGGPNREREGAAVPAASSVADMVVVVAVMLPAEVGWLRPQGLGCLFGEVK
jgi:hypothetical protein